MDDDHNDEDDYDERNERQEEKTVEISQETKRRRRKKEQNVKSEASIPFFPMYTHSTLFFSSLFPVLIFCLFFFSLSLLSTCCRRCIFLSHMPSSSSPCDAACCMDASAVAADRLLFSYTRRTFTPSIFGRLTHSPFFRVSLSPHTHSDSHTANEGKKEGIAGTTIQQQTLYS